MGYPYGDTYLETIRKNDKECQEIKSAFNVLKRKYIRESNGKFTDEIELSIKEQFEILGEAFELASWTLDGIADGYHFMQDVVERLLEKP